MRSAASSAVSVRPQLQTELGDVWDTDEDICPYCATPLADAPNRCPGCNRSLVRRNFRYPATAALPIFWVLLVGVSLTLGFHAFFKLRIEQNDSAVIVHLALAGALLLLSVGVYLRLAIAHYVTTVVLIAIVVLSISNFFIGYEGTALGAGAADSAISGVVSEFVHRLSLLVMIVQLTLSGFALFFALLRVGPEFEKSRELMVARTEKGLHTPGDFHAMARKLAKQGLFASAILHWQRATSIDPSNIVYKRHLARSYIRLGFLERGLSLLQSAKDLASDPQTSAEIDRLMRWVSTQANARGRTSYKHHV